RGGAFIGQRRRVNLGGELVLSGQPTTTDGEHFVTAASIAFAAEYGHPIGKKKNMEVGGGGVTGFFLETLRHNGTSNTTCPEGGNAVSTRGGFLLAGRFNFVFLLGKAKKHELGLRLTPGLGLPGAGSTGGNDDDSIDCGGGPTVFEELELDGPELVVTFDIGYAPRF
ncbi:MAG: hypothetical protein AAFZ07_29630, partial [Actinomycetota bacterium]